MSEQNKDADLRQIVTEALVSMISGVTGLVPPSGPGSIPDFVQAPIDRAVERISASLPVGVPDGYMPIPTAEQIADALDGVRCYHDMSAELIAPELLANLLAVTSVKAEQGTTSDKYRAELYDEVWQKARDMGYGNVTDALVALERLNAAPSLPAAGSAVEEVEVVAYQSIDATRGGGYMAHKHQLPQSHIDDGALQEPLMTVAQHERIVAVLRAQIAERDAAIEEWSGTAVQNGMDVDRLSAALSAQQSAHVSVPRERIQIALDSVQNAMEDAYNNAYQNCCGRGNGQCCGDPEPAWSDADHAIMDALAPAQRELRALLNGGEA